MGHDADCRAQRLELDVGDVLAIDEDAPRGRVVEPEEQPEDGRLAAARGSDERDPGPGGDGERERAEDRTFGAVSERDVLEANLASVQRKWLCVRDILATM